jgi:hypothetical protein
MLGNVASTDDLSTPAGEELEQRILARGSTVGRDRVSLASQGVMRS